VLWPFFVYWTAAMFFALLLPVALGAGALLGAPTSVELGAALGGTLLLTAAAFVHRTHVVHRDVAIASLPPAFDGYRIVQLSDLHCGPFASGRRVEAWVAAANRLEGDLVAVTGDLIASGAAFVPVVGEARWAIMAARLGRPAARLITGMAEGAVGAALTEPFVYAQAKAEQADYGLMDSLLNVAFGTVLGGGLHVGAGWLKDRVTGAGKAMAPMAAVAEAAGPDARQVATHGAVAAVLEGRPVRVGDLLAAAQPDFKATARRMAADIERMEANNLGGRFTSQIADARERMAPYSQVAQIDRTISRLEEHNLSGRFNQRIEELRNAGDERARQIVEDQARAAKAAAPMPEPAKLTREAMAERMVSGEARRADQELLAAQEADLRETESKLAPEVLGGKPSELSALGELRNRQLEAIAETKARLADPIKEAEQPLKLTTQEAYDRIRGDRQARMNESTRREAAYQKENNPTFYGDDIAPAREIDERGGPGASTPTDKADLEDSKKIEEDIQRLTQQAAAAGIEMPADVAEADELVKAANANAKALDAAAFCLTRAA